MGFLRFLFSFHGRFGVGDYCLHLLVVGGIGLLGLLLTVVIAVWAGVEIPLFTALVTTLLVSFVGQMSALVRRFHDRGCSGWWLALILVAAAVPLSLNAVSLLPPGSERVSMGVAATAAAIGIVMGVSSIFVPGARGPNRYGPAPGSGGD